MLEKINYIFNDIENTYDVKILFATEVGSRLWNTSDENSDYDVKFVYYSDINYYLDIFKNKNMDNINYKGDNIDMVGWDISKFLKLLSKSNPQTIDWIKSNIVYKKVPDYLFLEAERMFNSSISYNNYASLAKSNYMKYIKGKKIVPYKKYIHIIQAVSNALWVTKFRTHPPTDINDVMKAVLSQNVIDHIFYYIENKHEVSIKSEMLNKFIEKFIENKKFHIETIKNYEFAIDYFEIELNKQHLNKLFLDIIGFDKL